MELLVQAFLWEGVCERVGRRNWGCLKSVVCVSFPCYQGIPSGKTEIKMFKNIKETLFRENDMSIIIIFVQPQFQLLPILTN